MLLTSSRDNWERLVTAVVKKQQIWELCHQQSISTISSSDDLSEWTLSTSDAFSVHPSPRFPPEVVSFSQVSNNASSRPFVRMLFSAWYRMRKSKDKDLVDIPAEEDPALKRFSFRELQVATDKFSNKNIVWQDDFWKVYKGRLADGSLVSVKRHTKEQTFDGGHLFQIEVEIGRMAMHHNLCRLCGLCITRTERLLVYPYMANGSVASFLRDRPPNVPPLDWETRKRIALGSARGLSYLHDHCDQKIIHRDVKASNIFLDDEFEAVVGDFSLAQLMDHNDTHATAVLYGSLGHMAPGYLSPGEMSEKTDVYAYGITLLDLIMGQRAFDHVSFANYDNLPLDWVRKICKEGEWERMVDADCESNYMEDVVKLLLRLSVVCTRIDPKERPKMCEVVGMLEDGDGLGDERWKEWIQDEFFSDKLSRMKMQKKLAKYPYSDWIIDDDFIPNRKNN